jgi:hypothetical protein
MAFGLSLSRPSFSSTVRSEWLSTVLGIVLGIMFGICFLTGLVSHLIQHPLSWLEWPATPAYAYRLITATHSITGVATVPLLVGKLWAVYPKLRTWPLFRDLRHALERLSLVPLVAGSLVLLTGGMADHFYWFKSPRFFTPTHYWVAWITMGALLVHIGARLDVAGRALRRSTEDEERRG